MTTEISAADAVHLQRCIQLAIEALEAGDDPFGSVLVDAAGRSLAEAVNREATDRDPTAHPEFELARWAIQHLTAEQRAAATVYTSGEHCAMCAAAHGWAGLGRVVAAASAEQLAGWRASWGLPAGPVATLPFGAVVPGADVTTPVPGFDEQIRAVHERARGRR
jgi:tRNA(Arg) A34 adenosine deaminase TadA